MDFLFMLPLDGIVPLNSSFCRKNTIVQSISGQLDVFWVNSQACSMKTLNPSNKEKYFSLEKHAILSHHPKIHKPNIKKLMIFHTPFQINCNSHLT